MYLAGPAGVPSDRESVSDVISGELPVILLVYWPSACCIVLHGNHILLRVRMNEIEGSIVIENSRLRLHVLDKIL